MKPAAIVFDLDDTLFPERDYVLSGFAAVDQWLREKRGITGFFVSAERLFSDGNRGHIFDDVLAQQGIADATNLVPELVAVYRSHIPKISLHADARSMIERFHGKYKLGLITDGYAAAQRRKVEALGVSEWFDSIIYTDDLGRENWKPSPLSFQLTMERLGVVGEKCVYVGDNPRKDFAAPNALNWQTVWVLREEGEYGKIAENTMPREYRAKMKISTLYLLHEIFM